jgi:hypothetical protein
MQNFDQSTGFGEKRNFFAENSHSLWLCMKTEEDLKTAAQIFTDDVVSSILNFRNIWSSSCCSVDAHIHDLT